MFSLKSFFFLTSKSLINLNRVCIYVIIVHIQLNTHTHMCFGDNMRSFTCDVLEWELWYLIHVILVLISIYSLLCCLTLSPFISLVCNFSCEMSSFDKIASKRCKHLLDRNWILWKSFDSLYMLCVALALISARTLKSLTFFR